LRDSGTTILLTTHDLDEARALSDRAAIPASGRLAEEGPIGLILSRMFRGQREIVVTLSLEPPKPIEGVLQQLGFSPTVNPLEWTCWPTELNTLSQVQSNLRHHGIALHEVRLSEPGLEHVLSHVKGGQS
jgi:ABC-2 type transport system ATP-binding protein